ncbi:MAG: DNA primase [Ilumatobacteraceae bacterium]|nr:DNA primase [Ilumatobacteraceae bacterium]
MGIVDDDIERVRVAISIVDVVSEYVTLRRVGRSLVGLCPFHSEKSGSFNVREDTGRFKCFGCDTGGDVFKFIQDIEHLDFVASVERLALRAGVELHYTTGPGAGKDRKRRQQLLEVMEKAVAWYEKRLLESPDGRAARDYLRSRGISGDIARQFRLGWAPDDWDTLCREIGVADDLLREVGLGFTNKRGRMQDSFRARVLFPIFDETGVPVAFGGRVLPGSDDPAKYKNSSETPIYAKSRTLYGVNWAKNDIVKADTVVVCEGYTDVIGFHRSGVGIAVATCGTALTEDHVRLLKRFATKVVLAFDADSAGQGAAARFYEWEKRYDVQVSVARFPQGKDPGDLASSNPDALRDAVSGATPFLGFRVQRALNAGNIKTPEGRARTAESAIMIINEHPDINVRRLYASEVAMFTTLPAQDMVRMVERGGSARVVVATPVRQRPQGAGFVALTMLIHRWNDIAPWLVEALFVQDTYREAFKAIVEADGNVEAALLLVEGEARDIIERAAVSDFETDPILESRALLAAAVRRELAQRVHITDADEIRQDRQARITLSDFDDPRKANDAAVQLLQWLTSRTTSAA